MLGMNPNLYSVKPSPDFMATAYKYVNKYSINSLVEGSTWASWDARGVPALWASTDWHMPLDKHQHQCCASSQTAMPRHVSSRTRPLRLRTPAEHLTRSYLPAGRTTAHLNPLHIMYVNSLPSKRDFSYNSHAVEDAGFLRCDTVSLG